MAKWRKSEPIPVGMTMGMLLVALAEVSRSMPGAVPAGWAKESRGMASTTYDQDGTGWTARYRLPKTSGLPEPVIELQGRMRDGTNKYRRIACADLVKVTALIPLYVEEGTALDKAVLKAEAEGYEAFADERAELVAFTEGLSQELEEARAQSASLQASLDTLDQDFRNTDERAKQAEADLAEADRELGEARRMIAKLQGATDAAEPTEPKKPARKGAQATLEAEENAPA